MSDWRRALRKWADGRRRPLLVTGLFVFALPLTVLRRSRSGVPDRLTGLDVLSYGLEMPFDSLWSFAVMAMLVWMIEAVVFNRKIRMLGGVALVAGIFGGWSHHLPWVERTNIHWDSYSPAEGTWFWISAAVIAWIPEAHWNALVVRFSPRRTADIPGVAFRVVTDGRDERGQSPGQLRD